MSRYFGTFSNAIAWATDLVLQSPEVDTGRWQGYPTEGRPDLITHEAMNVSFDVPVYRGPRHPGHETQLEDLRYEIRPNLPWADDHFEERVSRVPSNPGEQYLNWPWWHGQADYTMTTRDLPGGAAEGVPTQLFTHTYQERFWPKYAGNHGHTDAPNYGIRYFYGDLDDVVNLLVREPYTRQATFPIFFPEDTGAVHGGRIPCTLHYHFLMRDDHLHMWYPIRSCDVVRHLRDDLYMAARLMLWVIGECMVKFEEWKQSDPKTMNRENIWKHVLPGTLHFTAYSLHIHKGDLHHVK